jgi:hypothetical protein
MLSPTIVRDTGIQGYRDTGIHRRLVLSSALPTMALFLLAALPSHAQDKLTANGLGQDDYEVAAAVLKYVYPKGATDSVMLATKTATFACNPPVDNGFDIGGCSGMRAANVEPEGVMYSVRAAMPAVPAELASRLVQRRGELERPIAVARPLFLP